ncbi:hypothetical protein MNV84_01328 [Leishmania braziliensis]|nr:hypothetical protein MNV84_01328 [Leishmania braziliensis]
MNPLDYLPPDVFTRTWGTSTHTVHPLGSHLCVIGPRYDRIAVASVAMETTGLALPPQFKVMCTGHTRTFLPTPHSGSCPLDYTALFVSLHRRQRERITCLHASRPVPLLASGSPGARRLHKASTSTAVSGWMTEGTPPSATATVYASQNTELDVRERHVERFATSSGSSTAPPAGSSESGLSVVEHPLPESVTAAMARVTATLTSTAVPSSSVGTAHPHPYPQQQEPLGTGQPHYHHHRLPQPDPRHMQYRVGRSGSMQPLPLPGSHGGTPSNTSSAAVALPLTPDTTSSALTSVPRDSTTIVSFATTAIRPSGPQAISTAAVEATLRSNNADCHYDPVRRDSFSLASGDDTPGEAAMENVQQSRWLLSRHPRQRMSGGNDDIEVDEVGSSIHGEVIARERLLQQLQRTVVRQRHLDLRMFDADDGEGDASEPQQRTAEHTLLSPDAQNTHRSESEGPRGGPAAAAAALHLFHGANTSDDADEIRADSVVAARGLHLAWAQTRARGSTSPSPQPHNLPLRWRRGQAARRRRPQPDAAQQGTSGHRQLSPSPAASVSRHTAGASSSMPASSVTGSRSAAQPAMSVSTHTAQMLSSPSIRVDDDDLSTSLHPTTGVVGVDRTAETSSSAVLPSPIPVDFVRRPSLPTVALVDVLPLSRVPSEEACGRESTLSQGDSSRGVSAFAHPRHSESCSNSLAIDDRHAAAARMAVSTPRTRDDFDCAKNTSEAHQCGVLDEDTPVVRRTSPGRSNGADNESRSRRSCSSLGATEPPDKSAEPVASVGGGGDDCVRSCRDSRLPSFSRVASLSPSSSSSFALWHVRTDTKAGSIDVGEALEEVDEAGGSVGIPVLSAMTPPTVYLSDMLRLSFSPDHGGDSSTRVASDVDEGVAHVGAHGGYTCSLGSHRRRQRPFLADDGNDDDDGCCESAASTSSSPPSQNHTAMRRVMGMEDEEVSNSNLSASPLSPLATTRSSCWIAAGVTNAEPSACTPHRVAVSLALSVEDRLLHPSTPSTVAWGRGNGAEHHHRGAAAATVHLTTTPAESSAQSSMLSIFPTPAQARLQSLLRASTWSTSTPCPRMKEHKNYSSSSSMSNFHSHPLDVSETTTGGRKSLQAAREGDDDRHVRGSSSSSRKTPTRLSGVYASPAAAQASAAVTMTPPRTAVAEAIPAAASPLHPSAFRTSGSSLQVQPGWRSRTSTAAPSEADGDNAALCSGYSGASLLSRAQEVDIQLLARMTHLTYTRGGSAAVAMTPKTCNLVRSPQHLSSSPLSSPSRCSTGSLSFFLAAAMASPRSVGGTRTSCGGGLSEDDEGRSVRAADSGVYGSAVARRRSWAPRKQQQNRQRRRQSQSLMDTHSSSASVCPISRTHSCGSCLSEALAVAPQRLTFGSTISSVIGASSNTDSAERWPTVYSTPAALSLPHPSQQRQQHTPPPPYAFSPVDACHRGDAVEEAVYSTRCSQLLPSEPRAASPPPSWALPTSSSLLLSPFAPHTPSERPSLSSTEFNQAPRRHGETRDRFSTWSVPSTSIASAAEQWPQHLRGSSHRSHSLSSRSGSVGGGRRCANRALSFSVLRSPPSALATPLVRAGLEHSVSSATLLDGCIGVSSPSPLNSGRQRHTSSDGSMKSSRGALHITRSDRSRVSASLMLQSRTSTTAPQPTLADELRLFSSSAFPSALPRVLVSPPSSTMAPSPLTTFIASPPQRTGPPTSTAAAPLPSSLAHSPRQRSSIPPEVLALMQMRYDSSGPTSASLAQVAERGATAPPCAFSSPSKSVQRGGCSERREVNVEPGPRSPCSPHGRGSPPPQ